MRPAKMMNPWAAYEPSAEAPWDLARVSHLHRRAGFSATWDEKRRDLKDGPAASVRRILEGKARDAVTVEEFEATATLLADSAVASSDPMRLKAWWIFRMMMGPDPLGERLTLMWHDHFATSNAKVEDLAAMRRQNETFRKLARAPFGQLLDQAVRDPALLLWLDAPANRKDHPNENLARELMELFTLGVGNYSETDVKQAARALTGWTVKDGEFREDLARHDQAEKVLFGQDRKWTGADLLKALREHPATSARLARKLCGMFFGEGVIDASAEKSLAEILRSKDLDIAHATGVILRSRAFFAGQNVGNRVLSPVEFVVGSSVSMGRTDPPPSTLILADWAGRLGQDLFYPPNVGGWPGGRSWLSSRALIGRANFAATLVGGEGVGHCPPLDALAMADQVAGGDVIAMASRVLLGREPDSAWRGRIASACGTSSGRDPEAARRMVTLAMASPEAQLG